MIWLEWFYVKVWKLLICLISIYWVYDDWWYGYLLSIDLGIMMGVENKVVKDINLVFYFMEFGMIDNK